MMNITPTVTSSPTTSKSPQYIKIRSPSKGIKVYSPDLIETSNQTSNDKVIQRRRSHSPNNDLDKINQAWNNLKINALSRAIAIAPEVNQCTLGPRAPNLEDHSCFEDDTEKLDLKNIVTSTPLKPKALEGNHDKKISKINSKNLQYEISGVREEENDTSPEVDEFSNLEYLKTECLNIIEEQIRKSGEIKKNNYLKKWIEFEEKIKEKLLVEKIRLERENLARFQEFYQESQKQIRKSKETSIIKISELQQSETEHVKRIAEKNERLKQIDQKRKEIEEKAKKFEEEKSKKAKELQHCIDGIYKAQAFFRQEYSKINEIIKKCKDLRMLQEKMGADFHSLKEMNNQMIKFAEKNYLGKVKDTPEDLKLAEAIVQKTSLIKESCSRNIEEINRSVEKAEEEKRKEEAAKELKAKLEMERQQQAKEQAERQQRAKEQAERQQRAKEQAERQQRAKEREDLERKEVLQASKALGIEDCISGENLKRLLELSKYLEGYEKSLEPLLTDNSMKKFRFDCQKVVNLPVNAISPLDDLHLEDKWYKLSRLLQGQAVPLGNSLFLATGHPLGVAYCTNLLAKKFVKQGEHTVSSKPEAAFAIAAVIVSLWADFPDFGRLILAHFYRECPYLVPAFMPQTEGQSDEDYYKMLGYQYSEDGKVEPQDKFLRRMSGIMRLYSAILITPLKKSLVSAGKKQPHGMEEAWRWLCSTLNLSPRPDISASLLFDFLEVTGHLFFKKFGSQYIKILQYLIEYYFLRIKEVTPDGCGGPVFRLKSFLEKIIKERIAPPPPGVLPPNFW